MAEIVNLRQARKAKDRADKEQRAERNRARHGRTKAEKDVSRQKTTIERKRHDDHRRDDGDA